MIHTNPLYYTWKWALETTSNNFTECFLNDSEKLVNELSISCNKNTPNLKISIEEVLEKISKLPLDLEEDRKAIGRLFKSIIIWEENRHNHLEDLLGLYLKCVHAGYDKLARVTSLLMNSILTNEAIAICSKRRNGKVCIQYLQSDEEKLLMMLTENANLIEIEKLIQTGVNVNTKDPLGFTPLHVACTKGHLKIVQFLLTVPTLDINAINLVQETPLMLASYLNYKEICNALITSKAFLRVANKNGDTALLAASVKGHLDIIQMICNSDKFSIFDVNSKNRNAVQLAVSNKSYKVVDFLLTNGVTIDIENELQLAIDKFAKSQIQTLAQKDLSAIGNIKREEFLDIAFKRNYIELFTALFKPNIVDEVAYLTDAMSKHMQEFINYFKSQGITLDYKKNGKTKLLDYCEKGDKRGVEVILRLGADINMREDGTEETALMKAVQMQDFIIVKSLVDKQASLDLSDSLGNTALIYAHMLYSQKIIDYLVLKGANITIQNHAGKCALTL